MLNCNDVTALASDWLDNELTLTQRMRVQAHLWMCRHCRNFVNGLSTTRRLVGEQIPGEMGCTADFVNRIQRRVDQRLSNEAPGILTERPGATAGNDTVFQPVGESNDARVQAVFAEIREREGYVPNLFRSYAHNPEQLEQVWSRVRSLMYGGQLSATLKNAIAVLISHDNGCDYCVFHHRRMLRRLGIPDAALKDFLATARSDFLDNREQVLLGLVREANRDPHHASSELLAEARQAGATDEHIIEAMSVMELYAGFNRLLDTFRIPIENDLANEL